MKKLRLFFLLLIPLIILFLLGFNYLWNMRSMQFSAKNLLRVFPEGSYERERPALASTTLHEIFSQEFAPLGEGAQCYALASLDGKYVIKLFKARHMRKKKWMRDGPLFASFVEPERRKQSSRRWMQKFEASCARYQMAYNELQDETGLIYLHFNQTKSLPIELKLKDGQTINLNELPFILQKKGELVPDRINSLLKNEGPEAAAKALQNISEMLSRRTKKGFTDARQCLSVNYAFAGELPMQIDVGKIVKEPKLLSHPEEEIERIHANVEAWTARHFPQLLPLMNTQN